MKIFQARTLQTKAVRLKIQSQPTTQLIKNMKTYEIRAGYESHVWDTKAPTLEAAREKAKAYITELNQHGPWGQSGSYTIEEYTNWELTLVVQGGLQRGKWWEV